MKYKKLFFKYKSILPIYKKKFDGTVETLHKITVSNYIPNIIKQLIYTIPDKYNNYYIICPFYDNNNDFQIGITETSKINEDPITTIKRGINEEVGLNLLYYYKKNIIIKNNRFKSWFGITISKNLEYSPNKFINNNNDTINKKIAVVIFDKLKELLNLYKNLKINDINSDNISSIGFISVKDCKNIIENNIFDKLVYNY